MVNSYTIFLSLYGIVTTISFLSTFILKKNFSLLKHTIYNNKKIQNDCFQKLNNDYNYNYFGNYEDFGEGFYALFVISFIPILDIIIFFENCKIIIDILKNINKFKNNSEDYFDLDDIKNNINKYLDSKTQDKEQKIIEEVLNNKKNPYYGLICENTKKINDLITDYEKNDYILNPERTLNFNKTINDTIINFVQAIELIDELNIKNDTVSINIENYKDYLSDLKFKLNGGIN